MSKYMTTGVVVRLTLSTLWLSLLAYLFVYMEGDVVKRCLAIVVVYFNVLGLLIMVLADVISIAIARVGDNNNDHM